MVWDEIKEISKIFQNEKNNLIYDSSMATNGYLIDETIAKEMYDLKFKWLQITVDGPKKEHNKIRFTKTDHNTYGKVINGIKNASRYLKIKIRFNVNKINKNLFIDFLKDLKKYNVNNNNIEIYVKSTMSKQNSNFDANLINDEIFFDEELKYLKIAENEGFKYSLNPNFKSNIRCIYHQINSYAIDPQLNLYKCAEHIGMEENKIGKINNTSEIEITNHSLYNKSFLYSPIAIEECRNCKVLPICNGKCPVIWEKRQRKKYEGCIPEKKVH